MWWRWAFRHLDRPHLVTDRAGGGWAVGFPAEPPLVASVGDRLFSSPEGWNCRLAATAKYDEDRSLARAMNHLFTVIARQAFS